MKLYHRTPNGGYKNTAAYWVEINPFCSIRRFGRVRMPARLRTIHILQRKEN